MNSRLVFALIVVISITGVLTMCSTASLNPIQQPENRTIEDLVAQGDFTAATQEIQTLLESEDLSDEMRKKYQFEIERLDRIRKDFQATRAEVEAFIKRYYPEVTEADFQRWETKKSLEWRMIDGKKMYFNRAARNLFRIDSAMKALWPADSDMDKETQDAGQTLDLNKHALTIIEAATTSGESYVEPRRLRIKQSVSVKADEVPDGEVIRCWIPYPRHIPGRQEEVKILNTEPMAYTLAPEEKLQRTIYFEKTARAGESTDFSVEYEMTAYGVYRQIDPDQVIAVQPNQELAAFLGERPPHIVFSPELRALSADIIGTETNPYRQAQLLFEWVDIHIPWASAREYSSISCIPAYAYENGHGDCGIQTLLFMTLCRINGIPTRWQSGWELQPPDDSMHDWGLIYFEPYGWVPMDVTYGLRESDDTRLKWFYLSGMDSYRIIFNDDISQEFYPEKTFFRSETIDSQRGEVEWSGGNLYFDQWRWNFEWEVLE